MLGLYWASLGPSWAYVGPSWSQVEPKLGHLGAHLGPSWGHVGGTGVPLHFFFRFMFFFGEEPKNTVNYEVFGVLSMVGLTLIVGSAGSLGPRCHRWVGLKAIE